MTGPVVDEDVYCPTCGARAGEGCVSVGNRTPVDKPHRGRTRAAARRRGETVDGKPLARQQRKSSGEDQGRRRSSALFRSRVLRGGLAPCAASTPACPPGVHRAEQAHHVLPRSRGGTDELSNGLPVCAAAHAYIHAHPLESYVAGWLRRTWDTAPSPGEAK